MDLQAHFGDAGATVSAPTTTLDRGHGRVEWRTIRVSSALPAAVEFPGLCQVAQINKRVIHLPTGEVQETVQYLATSLAAEQVTPAGLLALARGHWAVENRLHHVQDDSFGADRHVQHPHTGGLVLGVLRNLALNLLRGRSFLWRDGDSLPARARAVAAQPWAILLYTRT
jgi:hypothetical protein